MSGTAAIQWSVSGVGSSAQTVDGQDVTVMAGTINIEHGQWLAVLL